MENVVPVIQGFPVLVSQDAFKEFVGCESLDDHGVAVYRVSKQYENESGQIRNFDVVLRAFTYRDFVIVTEAVATGKTGFRKYSHIWRDLVLAALHAMERPSRDRIHIDNGVTKILVGATRRGEAIEATFQDVAGLEGVQKLLETADGIVYLAHEGNVYSNYTLDSPSSRLSSPEQRMKSYLDQALYLYDSARDDMDHLIADGVLLEYFCKKNELRFYFDSVAFGKHGRIRVLPRGHFGHMVRTFEEARILFQQCDNKDELEQTFTYIHPDLLGVRLPELKEGDTVEIAVQDESDEKRVLNGVRGVVVRVYEFNVQALVKFLGYFEETFYRSDLKKIE